MKRYCTSFPGCLRYEIGQVLSGESREMRSCDELQYRRSSASACIPLCTEEWLDGKAVVHQECKTTHLLWTFRNSLEGAAARRATSSERLPDSLQFYRLILRTTAPVVEHSKILTAPRKGFLENSDDPHLLAQQRRPVAQGCSKTRVVRTQRRFFNPDSSNVESVCLFVLALHESKPARKSTHEYNGKCV